MFVKIKNNKIDQYPYTVGDLRRDHRHTSFPKNISEATMASFGMFPVGYEAAPEYDPMTHRLEHSNTPVLKNGKWVLTKTVVALTEDQIASRDAGKAKEVRDKRNKLLNESDWTQISDAPVDQDEWKTYRQALRDITNHENFPYLSEADWPVKPV